MAGIVVGLAGHESHADAQIQLVSEERYVASRAQVGLEVIDRRNGPGAPFVLWQGRAFSLINFNGLGQAGAAADSDSVATPSRIDFDVLAEASQFYGLLETQSNGECVWRVRFRVSEPVDYDLNGFRSFWLQTAGSLDALLRLHRIGGGDEFRFGPVGVQPDVLAKRGRLMPGEYVMELIVSSRPESSAALVSNQAQIQGTISFASSGIVRVGSWRWRRAALGNGNVYQSWRSTQGPISWTEANRVAQSLGGLLATPTTTEENAALFGALASDPILWTLSGTPSGPWLGGAQFPDAAEPGGQWVWLSGEPFSLDRWWISQPDNNAGANRLAYFGAFNMILPNWGDYPADDPAIKSFIVELPETYCPADFNGNGFVDDTDFVLFSTAYDGFVCPGGAGCEGDLTRDGFVDDADFVVFTQAYDAFECPMGG